ncbi:hypothetical protein SLA2020_218450 [Shorea laevis]
MASLCSAIQVHCSVQKPSTSNNFHYFKNSLSSAFKPFLKELEQLSLRIDVSTHIKKTSVKLLDAFVDLFFEFVDQPLLPSQSNFAPVDELEEAVVISITATEGRIPDD